MLKPCEVEVRAANLCRVAVAFLNSLEILVTPSGGGPVHTRVPIHAHP